ncbi:MAG: Triosephosphate isomerase [uncultured Truepera sp.]|uniref:Triosephosphate isomerase n=1 Tax=uncultured Truepera sp. TaxID=543023 RepID=A0A6J4V6F8_9DEIN|nr:MAG: Triosephosphate isomerase [uncultured Truepera sp.]
MKPFIAANWKLHKLPSEMDAWVKALHTALAGVDLERLELALCAPYTHLPALHEALRGGGVKLGAQDVSAHDQGAYTGEVSAAMLKDVGVHYVIVGHSERREYHREDDALVHAKVEAVLGSGLVPILCVGEKLGEREAGQAEAVTLQQLEAALAGLTIKTADGLVVAYEPVWAIGTGKTATDSDAQAMCGSVRGKLRELMPDLADDVRVLYGGSMKGDNAGGLLAQPDVNGGLVGSASLDAASLAEIAAAC